jgi:hypothetical protein
MNEPVTVKEEVIMATYKCEKCGMADTLSTKTTYCLPTSYLFTLLGRVKMLASNT